MPDIEEEIDPTERRTSIKVAAVIMIILLLFWYLFL